MKKVLIGSLIINALLIPLTLLFGIFWREGELHYTKFNLVARAFGLSDCEECKALIEDISITQTDDELWNIIWALNKLETDKKPAAVKDVLGCIKAVNKRCNEYYCDEIILSHKCFETDSACVNEVEVFRGRDTIMTPLLDSAESGQFKELIAEFAKLISSCIESGKDYCDVTPDSLKIWGEGREVYEYYPDTRHR